jgi:ribose 5-phosphate isomerase B
MKIAIGNDHTSVAMKKHIVDYLTAKGYELVNFGTDSEERVDYPIYGKKVADAVASGECELGILICGTGIGISLAANKVKGIRAAVCSDAYSASMTRRHNNSNILAFGSRVVGQGTAETIVDAFLGAEYEGGRHQTRVDMISDIEEGKL